MSLFTFAGNPVLALAPQEQAAAPQLAVLCLSGSLGGLELNSLKFASWMQERGWRVTLLAPPTTPLATWAEDWFVPLETLTVRRGLAMPRMAWALKAQLKRLNIDVLIVAQNKDLPVATLVKTLLGGRLRVIYQQAAHAAGAAQAQPGAHPALPPGRCLAYAAARPGPRGGSPHPLQ